MHEEIEPERKRCPVEHVGGLTCSIRGVRTLPRNFLLPPADLFDVFERRASRREFNEIDEQDISTLLWVTQRHIGGEEDRVKRPLPTAGALASVRTFVIGAGGEAWLYVPTGHKAAVLDVEAAIGRAIRAEAQRFLSVGKAAVMIYAADRKLISSYYDYPESLVLRESGILLSGMSLASEALGLAFCPLGTLGKAWLDMLLGDGEKVVIPGGAALVGGR